MSENSSLPAPRRTGGQPGNCNARSLGAALKHGFYTRKFKKTDLQDVDNTEFVGLSEEIRILRLYIRAAVEACQSGDPEFDLLTLGRMLCLSLTTLNRLVTTHSYLAHNQDQTMQTLNQVLNNLVTEGFIKTEETQDIASLASPP